MILQIILDSPGVSAICGTLAELPYLIRSLRDKLQMPFQLRPVWLGNFVCPVIHYAILQIAVKMNHSRGIVHPELLPPLQIGVKSVATFSGVPEASCPVFLNYAAPQNQSILLFPAGVPVIVDTTFHSPIQKSNCRFSAVSMHGAWYYLACANNFVNPSSLRNDAKSSSADNIIFE